jgi:hypothetical protein
MNRLDATRKYLAPRRHVPRDYKDNKVGDMDFGALALARVVKERLGESERLKRYYVIADIDGAVYVLAEGSRVREFVDLHPELVVGVYDRGVEVGDLAGDLEDVRRAAA